MYKIARRALSLKLLGPLRQNAFITKYHFSAADSPAQSYLRCFAQSVPLVRSMASAVKQDIGIDELKNCQKDPKVLIIDVREKTEIAETGILPGAINIPLADVPTALTKNSEEFQALYHKSKPNKDTHMVFSCRSGRRSLAALKKAQELGYTKVQNFAGGWLEWEKHMKN